MKRVLTTAAAMLVAGTAFAQTTQTSVLGASGDSVYSLRVEGDNGVLYNCKDAIVNINGADSRECVRERTEGGSLFEGGDGLTVGAAAGGAALVVVLLASGGSNGTSATTTTGPSVSASDLRLKSDILRIGTTTHGLPLYQFRYTGQSQLYEGVMAQDVQQVMPDAVSRMDSGYLGVNYNMLGIEMRAVD